MSADDKLIVIVGAGPGGLYLADRLAAVGKKVAVYEKRMREDYYRDVHRSVHLTLGPTPRRFMADVGILPNDIVANRMYSFVEHPTGKKSVSHKYGPSQSRDYFMAVRRSDFTRILIANLDRHAESIRPKLNFHHKLVAFNPDTNECVFEDLTKNVQVKVTGDLVIGADGAHSELRRRMVDVGAITAKISNSSCFYLDLPSIPSLSGSRQGFHMWRGKGWAVLGMDEEGGTMGLSIFMSEDTLKFHSSKDEMAKFLARFDEKEVRDALEKYFAELNKNEQDKSGAYFQFPTVSCSQLHYKRVLLLGDAGHAANPFMGQGTAAALQDVDCLLKLVKEHNLEAISYEKVASEYTRQRKPEGDTLAMLAQAQFEHVMSGAPDSNFEMWLFYTFGAVFAPFTHLNTFYGFSFRNALYIHMARSYLVKLVMALFFMLAVYVLYRMLLQ